MGSLVAEIAERVASSSAGARSELEIRGGLVSPGTLTLSTAEPTVVDGNKLGQIDFQAPVEGSGTDAILVAASIYAEADDTFAADNNATELVFATGASEAAAEKMRITSDGKVGIGTSVPVTDLTIDGPITLKEQADADADTAAYGQIWVNTATPNELYFTTDAGDDIQLTTGTSLAFIADGAQTWNESGAAVDFRIESDDDTHIFFVDGSEDRIGIGVSDPDSLLEIVQTKTTGNALHVQRDLTAGSTNSPLVYFHQDHGDDDQVALHVRQDGDQYAIKINSYTGSSGDIYSEGQMAGKWTTLNTGTTPYNRFSFQALKSGASAVDDNDILFDIIASGFGGTAYRNASSIKFVVDGTVGTGDTPGSIEFWTCPDGTATLVKRGEIGSHGGVAFGLSQADSTSYSGYALRVGGRFTVNQSDGTSHACSTEISQNTASTGACYSANLHPGSDHGSRLAQWYSQPGGQWGLKAECRWNGDWYSATGTDIQTISDERLKENIEDYTGGLDVVNALQPRTYKWKDDFADGRTGTRYGFIAQEIENASGVEKEMNLFSTTETMNNPENEELTEKYETAISDGKQYATQLSAKEAVLVSAIKELSAKVKALEDA